MEIAKYIMLFFAFAYPGVFLYCVAIFIKQRIRKTNVRNKRNGFVLVRNEKNE